MPLRQQRPQLPLGMGLREVSRRRTTIGVGLYRDRSGISAVVQVRPLPPSEHRFPSTRRRKMHAWREESGTSPLERHGHSVCDESCR